MKMNFKHEELFEKIAEHFRGDANVRRAYGDPIQLEGRTIIPVANITYSYGFGEGGGWGEKNLPEDEAAAEAEAAAEGEAASGGGGGYGMGGMTRAMPLGVIEITPEGTVFLPVRPRRQLAKGLAMGVVLGLVLARLMRR